MSKTKQTSAIVHSPQIAGKILYLRGTRVLLDSDLAKLYGVRTAALNQAVQRNKERFPEDFMFRLNEKEMEALRSQFGISKGEGRGGRRYAPYAFTEQGVAMLSSVLRSPRAVQVNIAIMRTFVRLREMLATNQKLRRKIEDLEKRYDTKFQVIFAAIESMLEDEDLPKPGIGFHVPVGKPKARE
jgi:ORF6N domain-containing protein